MSVTQAYSGGGLSVRRLAKAARKPVSTVGRWVETEDRRRKTEDGERMVSRYQESKGTGNQEDGRQTTEGREFRIGLENVIFLWAELHKWREKASSPFD